MERNVQHAKDSIIENITRLQSYVLVLLATTIQGLLFAYYAHIPA